MGKEQKESHLTVQKIYISFIRPSSDLGRALQKGQNRPLNITHRIESMSPKYSEMLHVEVNNMFRALPCLKSYIIFAGIPFFQQEVWKLVLLWSTSIFQM